MDTEFKGLLVGVGLGAGVGLLLGFGVGLMLADMRRPEPQPEALTQGQRQSQVRPHTHPLLVSDGGVGAPGLPGPNPPREPDPEPIMPRREHVIIQRENFTTGDTFVFNEPGVSMPIEGPGTLVTALAVCDSDNFNVTVTADGQHIFNAPFTTLQQRSAELSRLNAYERTEDGKYVFSVGDYEYQRSVEVVIDPEESITFDVQRAEVDVVRGD